MGFDSYATSAIVRVLGSGGAQKAGRTYRILALPRAASRPALVQAASQFCKGFVTAWARVPGRGGNRAFPRLQVLERRSKLQFHTRF
jgi:hypothetical protein